MSGLTKDDVIRMAQEAGYINFQFTSITTLERFAALVAAAEREACVSLQREWQGLTNEEILEEYRQSYGDDGNLTDVYFARAIESKLKEKNHD